MPVLRSSALVSCSWFIRRDYRTQRDRSKYILFRYFVDEHLFDGIRMYVTHNCSEF